MSDQKPRVLVIDDDARLLRMFERVLTSDFCVDTATNATDALERLAVGAHYDAILCDRNLGAGMSGDDLYNALPTALQARVVMCSGTRLADDPFAIALADRFLLKPMSPPEMISVLLRVSQSSERAA